jgi:hypothetical protein
LDTSRISAHPALVVTTEEAIYVKADEVVVLFLR